MMNRKLSLGKMILILALALCLAAGFAQASAEQAVGDQAAALPVFDDAALAQYAALDLEQAGEAVRLLQERLAELGYLDPETAPDGVYSEMTAQAVKAFQKMNGVADTGVADAYTQALLYSEYALDSEGRVAAELTAGYVGNMNTMRFHDPACSSVDQMKDSNKVYLETREEAIEKGYVPCKVCNP